MWHLKYFPMLVQAVKSWARCGNNSVETNFEKEKLWSSLWWKISTLHRQYSSTTARVTRIHKIVFTKMDLRVWEWFHPHIWNLLYFMLLITSAWYSSPLHYYYYYSSRVAATAVVFECIGENFFAARFIMLAYVTNSYVMVLFSAFIFSPLVCLVIFLFHSVLFLNLL